MSGSGTVRVAAVDCGTNSLRLLIADVDRQAGRLTDVNRRMEIVRLGQGVDATGRLAPEPLARTLRMLEAYARAIDDASAGCVRMVATSAMRDAANGGEFIRGVTGILGVPPEVLSGDEEARLSFTGATAEFAAARSGDPLPPYLVVDIGGGSPGLAAANSAVAPVNDSRASSSPLSTSGGTPRIAVTPRMNSPPLAASLIALVATMRTRPAQASSTARAYASSTRSVRASGSGARRPVASTPWPSRTISIRRFTSVSRPACRSTSAMSSRSELVPQSTAATRTVPGPVIAPPGAPPAG